jgi:hypothetical protein
MTNEGFQAQTMNPHSPMRAARPYVSHEGFNKELSPNRAFQDDHPEKLDLRRAAPGPLNECHIGEVSSRV